MLDIKQRIDSIERNITRKMKMLPHAVNSFERASIMTEVDYLRTEVIKLSRIIEKPADRVEPFYMDFEEGM